MSQAEERYNAGVELQQQGRLQEAVAEYDEAIRLDLQYAEAYCNRALAYALFGRDAEAQLDIARATELGFDKTLWAAYVEEAKKQR